MKDRILKLCKRLDKFSLEEIVGIAEDIDESVMKLLLQTFVVDNYLKCDGDNYTYIKRSKTRKNNSKLPLFFQFHKQEDINYMIKGFCSNVEASKMITLFGFSKNVVDNFNQYFRTILYEKQRSELLKKFAKNPKIPQERVYMNTLVYLYLYDQKLYVSKTYLENKNAKKHTEAERLEIKNIYLRSYRKVLSRSFEKMFHLHLAEELWKYGKDFDEQYSLINKLLYIK